MKESMCDTCMRPGHCCKDMVITGGSFAEAMSEERAEHELMRHRLPMRPLRYDEEHRRWRFFCPLLQRDGRCGDYENRPGLCRTYQPGTDGLCVHHWHHEP